ncbi:hypothetical protein MJO28_015643 [Puccinia striiformis f. sp. tritici]|uniref:Uncharacterized protein n=1 Tax=Puccinia striiformis f. sp. tritici TaxID=168172 RepID=A0ACC0DPB3_9BASI|nr:hypothetical protein MJO28_015643 [Puccinia striiformis f. sp. tritici]
MAQLQHPSVLDQEGVGVQWQRFLDFNNDLADPHKSFNDFLDVVGLKTLEEHLDHLEELCSNLKEETGNFSRLWCQLLTQAATFEDIQVIWKTESDRSLEAHISQLACLQRFPRLFRDFDPDHEQRIKILGAFTSQEAEALLVSTEPTFDQGSEAAQRQRFLDLQPKLVNPEESFEDFLDIVGLETVKEHLDRLENLCKTLTGVEKSQFGRLWSRLINRQMKFDVAISGLRLGSDQSLQAHISQLAFSQQHPSISRDLYTTHEQRVESLDSSTSQAAEALFLPNSKSETLPDEIVAEGYDQTYLNAEDIVIPTLKTLQDCAAAWRPAKYLAPYTSLIAPALNGKTRLLKELSRHTCVVYMCIRPEQSSGWPPRSEWACSILIDMKRKSLEKQYERFFLAILHTVASFFDTLDELPKINRMEQWIDHSFPKKDRIGDPPFWLAVQKEMKNLPRRPEKESHALLKEALERMRKSTSFLGPTHLNLLLAIDEASQLFHSSKTSDESTFFRTFRHMLTKIPTASGVFAILADTTSQLSKFNPPTHLDSSHRLGKSGRKLFDPIYQFPTFDALVSAPPTTWQQLQSALRLLHYGSPFFGAYVNIAEKKQTVKGTVQDLIHVALEKLLGLVDTSIDPSSLTESQAIALLGCTIQPQLYGASHLNARLVASHSAQCMQIDPLRELLISEYPSQITFSSAANQYLALDESRLIRCIEILTFSCRQGHLGPEDVGALVSRIILSRAMQETMERNKPKPGGEQDPEEVVMPYGYPVRLVDFLQTLTGLSRNELELGSITAPNKKKLLDEGQLFWNHFVGIKDTPTSKDFLCQLHRGAAVHCQLNRYGFDLLFPIYLLPKGQTRLNEKRITFCGVQVKNKLHPDFRSHKWTSSSAKIHLNESNPYLVLFFTLRDPKKDLIPIPRNDKLSITDSQRQASLAFYSLHSLKFLSEGLRKALGDLMDAYPSISALHLTSPTHIKAYVQVLSPLLSSTRDNKREM